MLLFLSLLITAVLSHGGHHHGENSEEHIVEHLVESLGHLSPEMKVC